MVRTVAVKDTEVGPGIQEAWRKNREEMKEEHVASLCEGRRCRDAEAQLGGR